MYLNDLKLWKPKKEKGDLVKTVTDYSNDKGIEFRIVNWIY